MPSSEPSPAIPACPWAWPTRRTALVPDHLVFDPTSSGLARSRPASCCPPGTARCCSTACSTSAATTSRWTISSASASWVAKTAGPPRVRPLPGRRDDHRPAGPGPGDRRRHGPRRAHAQRPVRRRARRPPHLRHRRRRLPDGGHLARGDRPRRASAAGPADRPVRRQPDHDRRLHRAVHEHRPGQAVRRLGLAHARRRRARPGRRLAPPSTRPKRSDRPTLDLVPHRRSASAHRTSPARRPCHGSPLGADEVAATRRALGWDQGPFEVPDGIRREWMRTGDRGRQARSAWAARVAGLPEAVRAQFESRRWPAASRLRWRRRSAISPRSTAAATPRWPRGSPRSRCCRPSRRSSRTCWAVPPTSVDRTARARRVPEP